MGGSFFLEVSPDLPKALQVLWLRPDGCSMCRGGVIGNTADGGDGGNVGIKTTERVIVNTEETGRLFHILGFRKQDRREGNRIAHTFARSRTCSERLGAAAVG